MIKLGKTVKTEKKIIKNAYFLTVQTLVQCIMVLLLATLGFLGAHIEDNMVLVFVFKFF